MTHHELAALVASGQASMQDMASLGSDRVAQIKTNPELLQVRVKAQEPLSVNEDSRSISYLVSDETVDRMGDIIKVKGWDISRYKQNPVVLWAHDGKSVPPIGKSTNVRRRYGPARLTADIEFAPKEAFEFADTIYQLAARGFIRATSVGFMPTASEEVDEKKRLKLGMGPYGQLYTGAELMEISVVAVPANPSALQEGVKALTTEGLMNSGAAARFFDTYPANEEIALTKVRAAIRSFVDFGALSTKSAEDVQPEVDTENSSEKATEEKSPACRQDGESKSECVERKIPELIEEGMDQEQAVAVANSVCDKKCSPYEGDTEPEEAKSAEEDWTVGPQLKLVEAMTSLIEQQAEQTRATRGLVDSLNDLTKTLQKDSIGDVEGDPATESEAKASDAERVEKLSELVDDRVRGFAERMKRDLLSENNKPNMD
jgi:phage head maturation protease